MATKKQNILIDLENGILVNWLHDIKRYGSSCRSRIAELRQEGYEIESKIVDDKSGALAYYIPQHVGKGNQ